MTMRNELMKSINDRTKHMSLLWRLVKDFGEFELTTLSTDGTSRYLLVIRAAPGFARWSVRAGLKSLTHKSDLVDAFDG
jgi:hypothetical protein